MTIPPRRQDDWVVLSRSYPVAAGRVWEALTDPGELSRWYGTWSGDPADGVVQVTMSAEEGDTALPMRIDACDPERRLALSSDLDGVRVELDLRLREGKDQTILELAQHLTDGVDMGEWGPGWDFYLDRMGAALAGTDVESIAFEDYFPVLAEKYRALVQ